jgi:hypothetical protein
MAQGRLLAAAIAQANLTIQEAVASHLPLAGDGAKGG